MKKIVLLGIAILLGAAALALRPKEAACKWCPTYKCYGEGMCGDCVCMSKDYSGGRCISLEAKGLLERDGYLELK